MHSGQGRIRANVGCGASPTPGWVNLDNSWTVRLSRWPLLLSLLQRARLAGPEQLAFAQRARESRIRWSSALNLPFAAGSVEVIYSSHMLEHLGRQQARAFLAEVRRVLVPGGIVRLALPDLSLLVARYREDLSADDFVARTYLAHEPPRGVRARLRALAVGQRDHAWMYDGPSLIRLLGECGFNSASAASTRRVWSRRAPPRSSSRARSTCASARTRVSTSKRGADRVRSP